MIKVELKQSNGVTEIKVSGHARSDVCAGVSGMTQATILGLKAIAEDYPEHLEVIEEGDR